jgi:hypothetical protein
MSSLYKKDYTKKIKRLKRMYLSTELKQKNPAK